MGQMERAKQLASKRLLAMKLKQAEKEARRKAIRNRAPFKGLQIRPTASLFDDSEKREPGEDNWAGYGFDLHPHVTFPSMAVLAVFILLALMFKEHAARIFEVALEFITRMSG